VRVAELAAIALGLVVAGAVIAAPGLSVEVRGAALGAILTGFVILARTSRRRP
jgi:hypothetical protein